MAAMNKRLERDINDVLEANLEYFIQLKSQDDNMYIWTALILPSNPPYSNAAFRTRIEFPIEYPFKPPHIMLITPIYHPNIDEKGVPCLPIITAENWKPSHRLEQVVIAFVALINTPDLEHPVRPDVANLLVKSNKKFIKTAEEFCKKHAEKRPSKTSNR